MLLTSLRTILFGVALLCLMTSETCAAGGYPYQKHVHYSHQTLEHRHKSHVPPPRAGIVESVAIRRVARPQEEEDLRRPDPTDPNLEERVTKLESNFNRLNAEVSRLADLLQRQIDILDKTR